MSKVLENLKKSFEPTDIVIGGSNAKKLKEAVPASRIGDNANAFSGGFILREGNDLIQSSSLPTLRAGKMSSDNPGPTSDKAFPEPYETPNG